MNLLYKKYDTYIQCLLCPHYCKLKAGKTGICGVRKNTGESVDLLTYGMISGYSLDPVEKKPLYHFFPGMNILSLGSFGCNLRCDFCQNWDISQNFPGRQVRNITTDRIINEALAAEKNIGVAFTYNEPVIWFEFVRDVSLLAREKGLKTVMVSNGFVNTKPLRELTELIDAFNIDLKSFSRYFYKKNTGADIKPVMQAIKQISRSGRHLEITTLIIPGQNDSEDEMKMLSEWIAGELGKNVSLHISRYFPRFKRKDPATPEYTLEKLLDTASSVLDYVYLGNTSLAKGQNTNCYKCGSLVTMRSGYKTFISGLDSEGNCKKCGTNIYKDFTFARRGN
jgi:pyruvate formate lyase activating enzyme